ncbi:hypothetical protein ACQPYK_27815 [Streptosporangium sp. CA-135522]|uniref:hypothetical protein n=1 Tax=Streptosporangium sp. CA-135522 TaxID=3240072 RepID=UPI003D8E3886
MIQSDAATGKAADLLAGVQKALGVTPNMTKAMANARCAQGLPRLLRRPDRRRAARLHPREHRAA